MAGEQFSLVWNSFPRNLSSGLYTLLADEQLVDVTLAAEGQILRAHKLILSVCSTYFRDLFKGNSCKHPIVILKDVNYRDLSAMLHFMYQGEVNIKKEDIAGFLKVAETLQIKGLTTDNEEKLEESLTKSAQNLDQFFNTEKNSINSFTPDANASTFTEQRQFLEKDQERERQDVSSRDEYLNNETPDTYYQQDSMSDPTCNMQDVDAIRNASSANVEEECNEEEPLNCTSDINYTIPQKQEPLNYTLDMDPKTRYKTYLPDKSVYRPDEGSQMKDYAPEMQLVPYDQNAQVQPYGISNNSLPLETTLRVVSELGPTLRMERGKVIRMYSCPWCLRHFTRKENLKLHVRYIHGPLESLTCKLCGNKYKNSNSLRVHSYLYHNAKRNKPNKPFVDGGA